MFENSYSKILNNFNSINNLYSQAEYEYIDFCFIIHLQILKVKNLQKKN